MTPEPVVKKCVECHTQQDGEMTTCTYCGKDVCYDCRDEHEDECEDGE